MKNVILKQARTWLGTRFQHQGRIKKSYGQNGGVDCIGFIIELARELEICIEDNYSYERLAKGNFLKIKADMILKNKNIADLCATDIVLLKIEKDPQHFALVGENVNGLTFIHSYAPLKQVIEHNMDESWYKKIISVYKFPLDNKAFY